MRRVLLAVAIATSSPSVAASIDTATPAQDLDCAVWAASIAGMTTDKDVLVGVATLSGYFIGRYEAATGRNIDEAMFARSTAMANTELVALDTPCQARAKTYGDRLTVLGQRIVAAGKAQKRPG